MSITKILLVVLLCLAFSYTVQADCCGTNYYGLCQDGTNPGFSGCCGYGPCNIFCCNCDDGCRVGPFRPSYNKEAFGHYLDGKGITNSQIQDHLFGELDTNKDGKIDRKEVQSGKNTPVKQIAAKLGRSDL